MTDPRLTAAREFPDGARGRKVGQLPASVLLREDAELRRQLGQVLDVIEADGIGQADDDGTEPYCTACGEWAGLFLGLVGWHHFHGDPGPGGVRTLYDADHEAVIGWRPVPPRVVVLTANQSDCFRDMFVDAYDYRSEGAGGPCKDCETSPAQLCPDHESDLGQIDAYRGLARDLGIEVPS